MERFGEKLRTLRERRRLTLRELAPMLDVSFTYIGKMERGERTPNVAMVIKVAKLFNVTADVLIMDELDV